MANIIDQIMNLEQQRLTQRPPQAGPRQIPPAGTQALADPWIDPTAAFAGGFGANILRGGLASALRGGTAAAAADYPLGLATAGVEQINPALAMPFNIAGGMATGATFERALEEALAGGMGRMTPGRILAGQTGEAGIISDLANMPRWQAAGMDRPVTTRDEMTAIEELSELGGARSPVEPSEYIGIGAKQPVEILPVETIKETNKKQSKWFGATMQTPEGKYYLNRIKANTHKSAIHSNTKTGFSMDFSTDCPERLAPCPYCYVEQGRKGEEVLGMKGGAKKLVETPYRREILAMPQEIVDRMNAQGGLRAHSFSDYRPVQDYNQWKLALQDAEAKGLVIKAITKQPEFIEAFGDHPNLRVNISVDALPREMSNAPTMEEALRLKADRPNIKIRTVALNEKQAWEMAQDPRVDIVTMYHGRVGDKLKQIVEAQNPGIVKKVSKENLNKELDTWQDMSPQSNVFKRLAEAFPGKICCQSGKCGGDPTKCGFGNVAAGGIIAGVVLPEVIIGEDESADNLQTIR